MPLHCAILAGHSRIVSLLAAAGPPEALYAENGVGSTPYELAAHLALSAALRAQGPQWGRRTVYRGNPTNAQTLRGFSLNAYSGPSLDPQPGCRAEDAAEIEGFRKVLDAVIAAGVLSKKPQLLEALVAYAEQSEKEWEAFKAEGGVVSEGEEIPLDSFFLGDKRRSTGGSWGYDSSDPERTFEVFSKAVVSVHQRTLVHLKDVQELVFSAVDDSEVKKDEVDDGGLAREEEGVDGGDRSEFFLRGGIWQPKDTY